MIHLNDSLVALNWLGDRGRDLAVTEAERVRRLARHVSGGADVSEREVPRPVGLERLPRHAIRRLRLVRGLADPNIGLIVEAVHRADNRRHVLGGVLVERDLRPPRVLDRRLERRLCHHTRWRVDIDAHNVKVRAGEANDRDVGRELTGRLLLPLSRERDGERGEDLLLTMPLRRRLVHLA